MRICQVRNALLLRHADRKIGVVPARIALTATSPTGGRLVVPSRKAISTAVTAATTTTITITAAATRDGC